jgi:hypothetical protein
MVTKSERESSAQVELSMPIQVAGFGLLILFAGTFGGRWALLVAGLVLLFLGYVLSGVSVKLQLPAAAGAGEPAPDGR